MCQYIKLIIKHFKYFLVDIQDHDVKMHVTNTDQLFDEKQSLSIDDGSQNSNSLVTNRGKFELKKT